MSKINFLIWLFVIASFAYAEWPEELLKPENEEKTPKVPKIELKQTNGRSTYNTDNFIYLISEDSSKKVTQQIDYNYYHDYPLLKKEHYLNLEGEFIRKNFPFSFSQIGLNWSPSFSIDKYSESGISVGSFRLGPIIKVNYNTLPIRISGGAAVDIWHDSLAANISKTKIDGLNSDGGGYVGIMIGDNKKEFFPGIPFYTSGEIYGTYMSNSNITSGLVNGLFTKELNQNNEFSVYAADTLSKGRLANYTSGNFGTVDYTSSYDRTNNVFKGLVGYRRINGSFFSPGFLYEIDINTMNYPYENKALDEYRELSNRGTIFLENNRKKIIDYNGWMNFSAIKLDYLYRNKLPSSGNTGANDYKNPNEKYDTLVANEDDMDGRYVNLYNKFIINLFDHGNLLYAMDLERFKKIYPNVYTYYDNRETIRNDRDEITYDHKIDFLWNFNERLSWGILFNYRKDMSVYHHAEKSASNIIAREYKLETTLLFQSEKGSFIKENIGALNDQQEFPDYVETFLKNEFLAGNDLAWRPDNSRKFYSRLDMKAIIKPWISLLGSWYETLFDNGYWDIETWKSGYGLGTGNYVVQSKNIESEGMGIVSLTPFDNHFYSIGANVKNVITQHYKIGENGAPGKWVKEDHQKYYIDFNPFIEFKVLLKNRFLLASSIKRNSKFLLSTDKSYKIQNTEDGFWEAETGLEVYF